MSLTGVNNSSYNSPFSPATQQNNFRPYISSVNSVIEQDYEGRSSYSNDEDNIGGVGYERGTDSEEENDSYPNTNTFTTTEDEEEDDEMECSESDSEVTEDDQNNSSIQNHPFENGNNFSIHRNNGGVTNGNIINVSNPNNANSNSNNNNVLPPIQLHPPHSISTSTLNISTTQPPNRSIESDLPFGTRYPTLNIMNTRNIPPNHPPPPPPYSHGVTYSINPYIDGYSQRQAMFRSLHGSHPPSSYSSGTESISQPPMPSSAVTVSMPPQPKQGSLRFGFPDHQESRDREVNGEDEDDGSSTNSYDTTSSRKRARSISNEWAIPPQPQIQFGSIDPVNRSRQVTNHNHNHNLRTSSSPLSAPNRPPIETRIPTEYSQEITSIPATSISQTTNFYYPNVRSYAYQQSSSATASPPPIQMHQQPHFFNRRTSQSNQRRIYPLPLDSSSIRRSTLDERDNGYSTNFASSSSEISNVTYHDVSSTSQERRNQQAHNNNVNNTNISQVQRVPWGPRNDAQRGGRTESLVRPITPDPGSRRHALRPSIYPPTNNSPFGGSLESARVNGNNEEPDASVEISGNSDGEANIGNTNAPHNLWANPTRRSDTTNRHRTVAPTLSVATHISRGSSTDNHLSNEQLARRIQAREYGEEHSTIARLLAGTNRVRSTSRRDTGSNTSNSSRSGSIRRDTSSRGPIHRLPEILPHHDRHHSEERGNETRSRTHSSRSGQRNGRQSGHFLQHHLIQSYPLLGNFIDSSDIEIEEFWDLLPDILGSGIAANPDNYLDEDEFDTSYEGLIQLSERIGDAKPKGVPEHIINSLPTKLYSLGKGKIPEERCSICLTEYENNERLRDLPCTHDFHQECIDSWFKNSDKCPICRRSVTEN